MPDLHAIYHGPRDRFAAQGCDIRLALFRGSIETLSEGEADSGG